MTDIDIKTRRIVHLKREAVIAFIASVLSVFLVLPQFRINRFRTLSKVYLEMVTNPIQIFEYLIFALGVVGCHLILIGIFYNIRDISPKQKWGTILNQLMYGLVILGFAYYYLSAPATFNATIFERFIENKKLFYIILFSIIFYWVGNLIYFHSKYFKSLDVE